MQKAQKGRPREVDRDKALDKALHAFWKNGYEGTSLSDLTEAMGINRPSIYAAFGSKEELFRSALDRYAETGPGFMQRKALEEPTAYAVVTSLLKCHAEGLTDPKHPPGCLVVQGALICGDAAESVKEELKARRAAAEAALRERARARQGRRRPSSRQQSDGARPLHRDCRARHGGPGHERRLARGLACRRRHGHGCLAISVGSVPHAQQSQSSKIAPVHL